MADPTSYIPTFSFTDFEATSPDTPKPGSPLDAEFASLNVSIGSVIAAIRDIRRSDGALKNNSVGPDQLAPSIVFGFDVKGAWASGVDYLAADGVVYGTNFYKARVAHTSSAGSRPDLDSTTWMFLFSVTSISVTDGSITAVKLAAGDAAAFRVVIGQEETVAEGIANVSTVDAIADNDLFGYADTSASGSLAKTTWANVKQKVFDALGGLISALTPKGSIVDGDKVLISDSAASNASGAVTFSVLKSTVLSALGPAINGFAAKSAPVDADAVGFYDSADASVSKKVLWSSFKSTLKTYFDTLYPISVNAATQAQMEAASSTTVAVTPGRQQFHPSAAKVWGLATYASGVPTLRTSYNVSSITDTGAGNLTVTFATAFSSSFYAAQVTPLTASPTSSRMGMAFNLGTTSMQCITNNDGGALADPDGFGFACFGDQ